jgi:hypothetical protein
LSEQIAVSSLSASFQWLVGLCQVVDFGRIESLQVRRGEPERHPAPRIIRTCKMGSRTGPRPEVALDDFWLKQPVIDLIEAVRELGDGEILSITVMHGLPHLVEIHHRADL